MADRLTPEKIADNQIVELSAAARIMLGTIVQDDLPIWGRRVYPRRARLAAHGRRSVPVALRRCGFWLAFFIATAVTSRAVLFYSTADPTFNTTSPTGTLAESGWGLQGNWGSFLGTPIAPRFFLSAKHLGGIEGQLFTFAGNKYVALAFYDDPASDLRLWRIQGSFPYYASLYDGSDEVGRSLIVFGRGTQRGDPVTLTNESGASLRGWRWGVSDGVQRWGQSTVNDIATNTAVDNSQLLQALFRADSGTNEVHLSGGDSGGGLFINDGTSWKLAGINYAVSGPYNTTTNGEGFEAALFDEGGFYQKDDTNWMFIAETPSTKQPGAFYATRISARLGWINQVLSGLVMPTGPSLVWSTDVAGPYALDTTASVDPDSRTITIPQPASTRFYQIHGNISWRILSLGSSGQNLVLRYGQTELSSAKYGGGYPPADASLTSVKVPSAPTAHLVF